MVVRESACHSGVCERTRRVGWGAWKRPLGIRHKDDNMPFNSRKMRHHRPIQLEILYYPQVVTRRSGPTGTIPYSHYWHLNHEENHDNFAGAGALQSDIGFRVSYRR